MTKSIAKKSTTGSLPPAVPFAITPTSSPWTHTSDDSYIYQLSLVLATATVSLFVSSICPIDPFVGKLNTDRSCETDLHQKWPLALRLRLMVAHVKYLDPGQYMCVSVCYSLLE